ncbi:hypothetical protein TUM4637_27430 [Shewanella hafniensis]|uniref:hypothetical protein n=1 Tax=Shewanella hafniensis TaxID=365590 RepID=UPI001BB9415F|nr:hypothetical protein [Shewanella hafniensis]MCL1132999.1 hypothetical protein [Shewanella hafniensis]GIU33292.1 hypothetical protein TUM4637_27430 [Shewanella hafniensis]
MESIPLVSSQNPQLHTATTQADALNASPRPIPAQVQTSPEGDSITLNGTEYNLKLVNAQQRQILLTANTFLVTPNTQNTPPTTTATQNPISQLLALATPIALKVPEAVINLAQQNGISQTQLSALAARTQGYPLPNVTIINKAFQFANGTVVAQDPGPQLNQGEFLAKIAFQQGRPILLLTPIQSKLEIVIGAPVNETQVPTNKLSSDIVIAKVEPVQIIASFLKKLEAIVSLPETTKQDIIPKTEVTQLQGKANTPQATNSASSPNTFNAQAITSMPKGLEKSPLVSTLNSDNINRLVSQPSPSTISTETNSKNTLPHGIGDSLSKAPQETLAAYTAEVNKLKDILGSSGLKNELKASDVKTDSPMKVADVLQKAFNKAGTLPIELSRSNNSSNLASELLKHLPHIGLPPLSQLNDLDELKANILGLTSLNLATPLSNQASMFMNASAITSLFQLLLGFKANNSSNSMSKKLADYLEQLQAKVGFSTKQLGQLSKAGGLDSMGQLASNLHLYQQASNENAGNLVWFFALPYGINQRHEQLEGKFEQEVDSDDPEKKAGWRLQLKFNLAQGPLLIAAQQHNQQLDIQFKGNSQMLLNKVNNFLTPLSEKLSQLGFTPGELSTQIAQVPATLLPGDHFLVKTKA